jgi:hypothetical protein
MPWPSCGDADPDIQATIRRLAMQLGEILRCVNETLRVVGVVLLFALGVVAMGTLALLVGTPGLIAFPFAVALGWFIVKTLRS